MPKRFCVTGTCIPEKNYMVDISERLERIVKDYIEQGNLFYDESCTAVREDDNALFTGALFAERLSGVKS